MCSQDLKWWLAGIVCVAAITSLPCYVHAQATSSAGATAPSTGGATPPTMSDGQKAELVWQRFGLRFSGTPVTHVIIDEVRPGSLGARGGIEKGDEVVRIAGASVQTIARMDDTLLSLTGVETLTFTLNRGGTTFDARVALDPSAQTATGPGTSTTPTPNATESNVFGMFVHQVPNGPVLVDRVSAMSPAAKAGIHAGDMLISVGGHPASPVSAMIAGMTDFVGRQHSGAGFTVEFARPIDDTRSEKMTVQILPADAGPAAAAKQQTASSPADPNSVEASMLGLALRDVSPNTVSVTRVAPGSPAAEAGLVGGDIIGSVGDTQVSTVAQFVSLLGMQQMGNRVNMIILRQNKTFPTTMTLTPRLQDVTQATVAAATATTYNDIKILETRLQELSNEVQALQAQLNATARRP